LESRVVAVFAGATLVAGCAQGGPRAQAAPPRGAEGAAASRPVTTPHISAVQERDPFFDRAGHLIQAP